MLKKAQEDYRAAEHLFHKDLDWVTFHKEVLGVEGLVKKAFKQLADLEAFERTEEYAGIQQMVARLRERSGVLPPPQDSTRVITIRIPQSLHDALRGEAHQLHTSMNKLCISKLLQLVDGELVPAENERARAARKAQATEESPA